MYRKNCYKCSRPSFSSSNRGEWICPICGENLSELKATDAFIWENKHSKQHKEGYKGIKFNIK